MTELYLILYIWENHPPRPGEDLPFPLAKSAVYDLWDDHLENQWSHGDQGVFPEDLVREVWGTDLVPVLGI